MNFIYITFALGLLFSCVQDGDGPGNSTNTSANCQNVSLHDGFAFGACNDRLRILNLNNNEITDLSMAANDIAIDKDQNLALVLAQGELSLLSIVDPENPELITSRSVNFGLFSGLSAANGLAVISGGVGGSNTQVFSYSNNELSLEVNGISRVDSRAGTPDVTVVPTSNGISAFYSQDLGSVRNWGIQQIDISNNGQVLPIRGVFRLTAGSVPIGNPNFSPSNFPVESEVFNSQLYVANYATQGIEVIDLNSGVVLSPILLGFSPTHLGSDDQFLYATNVDSGAVVRVGPNSGDILPVQGDFSSPSAVAANDNFIVVADRVQGLVVISK